MNRLLSFLCGLSFVAAFGCSSPSASPSTVSPSDDSGVDSEPVPPAPFVPKTNKEFFEAAAKPVCERVFSCCPTAKEVESILFLYGVDKAPADAAACTAALAPKLADYALLVDGSISSGHLAFVPEEAAKCLVAFNPDKNKCADILREGAPNLLACPQAYKPLVAEGSACSMTPECVDSVCRPTNKERTAATCQPRGKENDFCMGEGSCEDGLVCSNVALDQCAGEKSAACIKPAEKGTLCCTSSDCVKGLDCYAEGDGKPMCQDALPTTPVDPICTGK